jgi:predicted TPR repeat methyltransferase
VLNYFGELGGVIGSIRSRLRPGGLFLASLEMLVPPVDASRGDEVPREDWRLQCQGRFAHAIGYVRSTAREAGLRVLAMSDECLRFEGGAPVAGIVGVFTPALQ